MDVEAEVNLVANVRHEDVLIGKKAIEICPIREAVFWIVVTLYEI